METRISPSGQAKLITARTLLVGLAASGGLLLSMPGYAQMGMGGPGMMGGGGMMNMPIRHLYVMQNGIDPSYASKVNVLPRDAHNIEEGKRLFESTCVSCHGPAGLGNGEAGKNLNPPPANIAFYVKRPIATDGFLYWTIAEGGVRFGTAMPPFKDALKED